MDLYIYVFIIYSNSFIINRNAFEEIMQVNEIIQPQRRKRPFPDVKTEDDSQCKKKWTNSEILTLIEVYKDKISEFDSAKTHTAVWNNISSILSQSNINFTGLQCKWKFTRLKTDYFKKIDNMKKTGAPAYSFKYFNEFNEIFKKDHNVHPISLASARRKRDIPSDCLGDFGLEDDGNIAGTSSSENQTRASFEQMVEADEIIEKKKVKPKTVSEKLLTQIEDQRKERKEAEDAKIQCIKECHGETIKVYQDMMQKLIDKL